MPEKSAAKLSDGSFSIDKERDDLDEETPFISLSYPDNPPSCLPKRCWKFGLPSAQKKKIQ